MIRLFVLETALLFGVLVFPASHEPLLLQKPTINRTHIVFNYAGDLWSVSRAGGEAVRLTAGTGNETDPHFSPDGTQIAFTGEYDGNVDVYVVGANGGVPKRLTYHPGPDTAAGWTPDGKKILFHSARSSESHYGRLFTMPVEGGGLPTEVPLPLADEGSFSPDATQIAYGPLPRMRTWKRYRGGRTTPIWIANLSDSTVQKLPRENSNDFSPMWSGGKIYFLSDRNGPITLFSYDLSTKKVKELVHNSGLDIKSASLGEGAIVYEQFGSICLYDINSGQSHAVSIRISADLPDVRPRYEKVAKQIVNGVLSPTGARAVFEAHGEILTVPAEKGGIRNLTNTPGVAERAPAWSPDGSKIAYFSDESGEYELRIKDQSGMGAEEKIRLDGAPSYYYWPVWSPDSKKIAYVSGLKLVYADLETKALIHVAADSYDSPSRNFAPSWSIDSRWIAYSRLQKNHMHGVYIYSLSGKRSYEISDGLSDAQHAAFDKGGKYLYFSASTNLGQTTAWLDMSSIDRQVTRSVYVAVLSNEQRSPLAPESDEEKIDTKAAKAEKPKESTGSRIDIEKIEQRILPLPIPARDYNTLAAGKEGTFFLVEHPNGPLGEPQKSVVHRFDLKTRKLEKILEGVGSFDVSANGEKIIFVQGGKWSIASSAGIPKPGEGALRTDEMEVRVVPKDEWKQMYNEVWRIERDLFYDPGLHGLNVEEAKAKYEPYLRGVASRNDLTYLFQEMLGEVTVGHMNVEGGTEPAVRRVRGGLLGADYAVENGRFRFAHVYSGENWNPDLRSPLTGPGVQVTAGEYLLAVNGRDLGGSDNIYSYFEGTSGKSVVLRVGPDPSGAQSREVTVVPIDDEFNLRNRAWMDANRKRVDQLSGGRLAYVYLPTTGESGYRSFNRYYFAQIGKEGAIIDERFNRGGNMADYIIDNLNRPLMNLWHTREGDDFTTPQNQIFGPKVLLINEFSASGGDALAWAFRQRQSGTMVGKRTWGGLVGIFNIPMLLDGGFVTAPNLAFYSPDGKWEVENHGVAPDIEVELDPAAVRAGHDLQLEKAVEVAMSRLAKQPIPTYKRPGYPNYHGGAVSGTQD